MHLVPGDGTKQTFVARQVLWAAGLKVVGTLGIGLIVDRGRDVARIRACPGMDPCLRRNTATSGEVT